MGFITKTGSVGTQGSGGLFDCGPTFSTITSVGGGRGATNDPAPFKDGGPGGSGGGSNHWCWWSSGAVLLQQIWDLLEQ